MNIIRTAACGTLESSDALITVAPGDGLQISIQSVVLRQFGAQIEASIRDVLRELEVTGAIITVEDRGAVDCVLRARCETALRRAAKEE